jgi:hypothetical protein
MPSATKLARMCEHGRPVLGYVFVKQDARLSERENAQILANILDQVEGVEDRGSCSLSTGQLHEP